MSSLIQETEKQVFSNAFGTVTDRRVVYFREKGWFGGGAREDVPMKHITSVRVEISRHPVWGIFWLLVGLAFFSPGHSISGWLLGALLAGLGILLLWGSPTVVVNTSGRDVSEAKGLPWHRSDAEHFAESVRSQLFRDGASGEEG